MTGTRVVHNPDRMHAQSETGLMVLAAYMDSSTDITSTDTSVHLKENHADPLKNLVRGTNLAGTVLILIMA